MYFHHDLLSNQPFGQAADTENRGPAAVRSDDEWGTKTARLPACSHSGPGKGRQNGCVTRFIPGAA